MGNDLTIPFIVITIQTDVLCFHEINEYLTISEIALEIYRVKTVIKILII